jgi:hypothetical protein
MSCDHTHDVLVHLQKSFDKFWPDCPYDIYIGSNTKLESSKYKFLDVKQNGWKLETLDQISKIQNFDSKITHLIVFLDDFILNSKVYNFQLNNIINLSFKNEIKYIRLKKIEEPLLLLIINKMLYFSNKLPYHKIRKTHPYYSSLQVAMWEINYLQKSVKDCINIWKFEESISSNEHYTVKNNIFNYRHIVEKGLWEFYAEDFCIKHINYFNESNREWQSKNLSRKLYYFLKRVKFLTLGYIKFSK